MKNKSEKRSGSYHRPQVGHWLDQTLLTGTPWWLQGEPSPQAFFYILTIFNHYFHVLTVERKKEKNNRSTSLHRGMSDALRACISAILETFLRTTGFCLRRIWKTLEVIESGQDLHFSGYFSKKKKKSRSTSSQCRAVTFIRISASS